MGLLSLKTNTEKRSPISRPHIGTQHPLLPLFTDTMPGQATLVIHASAWAVKVARKSSLPKRKGDDQKKKKGRLLVAQKNPFHMPPPQIYLL